MNTPGLQRAEFRYSDFRMAGKVNGHGLCGVGSGTSRAESGRAGSAPGGRYRSRLVGLDRQRQGPAQVTSNSNQRPASQALDIPESRVCVQPSLFPKRIRLVLQASQVYPLTAC